MEFRVLGPLEAWNDDRPVRLGGPKQRALLAILLLRRNEIVSRRVLIDELWGEQPPPSATHTLDTHVYRLRKACGEARVVTTDGGYVARVGPDELDLERFERLVAEARALRGHGDDRGAVERLGAALALWRGPPLGGLEAEPFASIEIQRLDELRLAAFEERFDAELALGRQDGLVPELQALVARNPLRERLHGQLMLALYREGRQVEALGVYRELRRHLADELGLEPGPALRAIEHEILRQEPELTVVQAGPAVEPEGRRRLRLVALVVAGAGLLGGAALAATLLVGGPRHHQLRVGGNAIALVGRGGFSAVAPLDGPPTAVAWGLGSLWVAHVDAGTVDRVDPRSNDVRQTIRVGSGPSALAAGGGEIWIANSLDGTVSRIDPATNGVVQTIRVGRGPSAVAVSGASVWIANTAGPSLSRIDARTGRVVGTVPLDSSPTALAFGDGAIWVTSDAARTVSRVDPRTDSVVATVPVGGGPDAIAVGRGSVWIANALDGTLSRIDPGRTSVVATIPVGGTPSSLAATAAGIWVGDELGSAVALVDPASDVVVRRLHVNGDAESVAAGGGGVWVGVRAFGSRHRGGRLVLLDPSPTIDSLDPAILYSLFPTQLLGMTNDGLVTFRHVGGSRGAQVVPDLAVALPAPAADGRTYRFRVRSGIRYSNGDLVRASDFRRALERLFELGSPGTDFYRGIAGATACRPELRCILSGVVADDDARTVTIHLTRPDPELLYKLALPFAYAVPPGTPAHDTGATPLPATGPYMIASYRPGHELRLVRNPRFHVWSEAAQPDGFADEIVWRLGVSPGAAVTAIEHGRADWMLATGPAPASRRHELETRFARQLHVHPLLASDFFVFNVHTPPFADVRVRRALDYAVDRRAVVRIYGGPVGARPACQILPAGMPGYEPYCPYTRHPGGGRWNGPDLARARRLVAASGTKGMHVTVWNTPDPGPWLDEGRVVVRTLRLLGYRASYGFLPASAYSREIGDTRRHYQISSGGWGADYPAASNFIELKLSCRAFRPASVYNENTGGFCDPALDRQIERARLLQVARPHEADALWARIDHELTDRAAWLPLVNPETTDFVSRRVGNYQYHPLWGLLVDQLWVR